MERKPDFENLLRVLDKKVPRRPTLFEFFRNLELDRKLSDRKDLADRLFGIRAFYMAGYDYATVMLGGELFPHQPVGKAGQRGYSLNENTEIADRAGFAAYPWRSADQVFDYGYYEDAVPLLEPGMKLIAHAPCGILENIIRLTGYDNLCFMTVDDPELVAELAAAVGSRLVRYYEIAAALPEVGCCIVNDDWGFNTQTMLAPADMRKYIIPWHVKMVETIHRNNKPAILHSCGKLDDVYDDIINVCKFDGKHSYEDKIQPVEEAYEMLAGKIAVLGGIDLDFVCRRTPAEIRERSLAMLKRSAARGGYALGTGNSVPDYVPEANYLAMIGAALT